MRVKRAATGRDIRGICLPIQRKVDGLVGSGSQSKNAVRKGVVKAFAFRWGSVKHRFGSYIQYGNHGVG